MSGVELDAECKVVYDEVQSKKKHRYVTFMIDGGKIKIDKIGERDNTYDMFLEDLMAKDGEADDCRYAIYDYEYVVHSQGTEPSNRSRLFLVSWCPDSARIKKKMVYSASFDSLKKAFTGVQKIIQANGADEVEQSYVESLLKSAARTWFFFPSKRVKKKNLIRVRAQKISNFETNQNTPPTLLHTTKHLLFHS